VTLGQAQVQPDADHRRGRAAAARQEVDEDAGELVAMHQHVVRPFQLHAVHAQLLERARQREPGDQRQTCRRRRAGREAPQGGEGQARAFPGQPLPAAPPSSGVLASATRT
jgi:hypothetical protein